MNRYQRHLNLPGFGKEGQAGLGRASVLVVGAGGLGVPVLQYLCAMGVGTIGIVDGDRIQLSNLQRQVLYTTADVGAFKVERALAALRALNPEVRLQGHPVDLSPANALELLRPYDLIVDATDAFAARYLINDACVILGKPWVFGAVHQYEGQLSVFNHNGGPTYRCLFPRQPNPAEIPDCELGGVLGVVPGIVGMRQALEAVKVLTGIGTPLSGTVLMIDVLRDTEYRMRLKPRPENLRIDALLPSYERSCDPVAMIGADALAAVMDLAGAQVWDVRSADEFAAGHLRTAVSIPPERLAALAAEASALFPVYLYCQRGARSLRAARELMALRPELQVYSVEGGIEACPRDLYAS